MSTSPTTHRGALALASMPFTFTQDDLLDCSAFISAAKERGYDLDLDDLQEFHNLRLLVPLYRVSDISVEGYCLDVQPDGNLNARWQMLEAARDGRLRDAGEEGYSAAWPYRRPANESDRRWWNGFLYSSWQLLDLYTVLQERRGLKHGLDRAHRLAHIRRLRKRTLALCALAPAYLPSVLARVSIPPGMDEDGLERVRYDSDLIELLRAVLFSPDDLREAAELLLHEAKRDPLHGWLPIVRHASSTAWSKLRGEALDCIWMRIAAEVLLLAHDDLAATGDLEPLPDLSGASWWTPLHDRLHRGDSAVEPLERALGSFGLSPHPRVLLVVEGETEVSHFKSLLDEFGIDRPERVRIQHTKGSTPNPQLLARYAITPRIGTAYDDGWQLDATPTALYVVMDPENKYADPQQRERRSTAIKNAIREEVELQGGAISDDDLNFMLTLRVWGEQKYELANFTNDELVLALTRLALEQGVPEADTPAWSSELRRRLDEARAADPPDDIKVIAGPMRLRVDKPALADLLWPTLRAKCMNELERDQIQTPILDVVLEVRRLVALLSGGGYVLRRPDAGTT